MRSILAIGLLGALATGCTRVVALDVEEGPKRLVVEARLERVKGDQSGRQEVRLSTTDAFDRAGAPPPAVGALVRIRDARGREFPFAERAPGVYRAESLVPVLGEVYTLLIDYDGDRYQGSDRLVAVAPIDSLYFVYEEKGPVTPDEGYRAAIDYTDPAPAGDYYLWEILVNDTLRFSPDPGNRFRAISEDRFYNGGRVVAYQPYDEEVAEPGERVRVRQVALTEQSFRYYAALFEQTTTGNPFSVPPSSVRGNVANLTNPGRYPLGYFLAAEVADQAATVPARP